MRVRVRVRARVRVRVRSGSGLGFGFGVSAPASPSPNSMVSGGAPSGMRVNRTCLCGETRKSVARSTCTGSASGSG